MIVRIVEIVLPVTTLPELELSDTDTDATNFAVIVPGPLMVAVAVCDVVEERRIEELLFVQLLKAKFVEGDADIGSADPALTHTDPGGEVVPAEDGELTIVT